MGDETPRRRALQRVRNHLSWMLLMLVDDREDLEAHALEDQECDLQLLHMRVDSLHRQFTLQLERKDPLP